MTQSDDTDYTLDMGTPATKAVLKDYYLRSKAVLAAERTEADVAYGGHPLQKFSIAWPAERAATRLAVLFFHGGWWKAGNKEDRMFLAEALPSEGVAYVSVGYPLMPGARLRELAESATLAVDAVAKHLAMVAGHRVPLVLTGNSAGAHLAAYATGGLAGTAQDASARGIVGMCVASGLYDLGPMRECFANEWLQLDEDDLIDLAPIQRLPAASLPMMVAAGALEPQGFLRQQALYVQCLRAAGAHPDLYVAPGHDHFTLIGEFGRAGSPLYDWLLDRRQPAPGAST
jgi:arylformamidase